MGGSKSPRIFIVKFKFTESFTLKIVLINK